MKTASLLLALGMAQLGLAAPVPQSWEDLVLPEGLSSRSIPVTRVSRWSKKLEKEQDPFSRRSSLNSGIAFDNRPLTPSGTVPASVALTATRPLHTTFLQDLSKKKETVTVIIDVEDDGTPVVSGVPAAVAHHYPAYKVVTEMEAASIEPVEAIKVIEAAEVKPQHWATPVKTSHAPSRSTAGEMLEGLYADYTPCWKKTKARVHRLTRGKTDLIVIGTLLALAIVLWTLASMYSVAQGYVALSPCLSFHPPVVLSIPPTNASIKRVRRDFFGFRQGTIRLEGGEREPCQDHVELEKTQA
ncbi:hypothetical protein ACHAQH_007388 [Verticillium albo-atrum]